MRLARERQGPHDAGRAEHQRGSHQLYMPAGQLLASSDSTIVTVQSHMLEIAPHADFHQEFGSLATSSANKVADAEYHLSFGPLPEVDKLLGYVAAHPDVPPGALQTATLILTENLPLSSFAKFNELRAGWPSLPDNKDFKAETVDILTALTMIKEIGVTRPLAVTIDPQFQVEGMIDPPRTSWRSAITGSPTNGPTGSTNCCRATPPPATMRSMASPGFTRIWRCKCCRNGRGRNTVTSCVPTLGRAGACANGEGRGHPGLAGTGE